MDIWKHCLMSQRKFGGEPGDYLAIHRFVDSSKLFCYHAKHRLLLHNLYGVELACELFHDCFENSSGKVVLIRDIVVEHCREDLSGAIPTLYDWLHATDEVVGQLVEVPELDDQPKLKSFVMRPYLRSGLASSLMITCSDFGVYLAELFLGLDASKTLADRLDSGQRVQSLLTQFKFTQRWQYTPDVKELRWLASLENNAADTLANGKPKKLAVASSTR